MTKHRVGSHCVMGLKLLGMVGVGVGDLVGEGSRRSRRCASDCHRQLPPRRHHGYNIFLKKGMEGVLGRGLRQVGRLKRLRPGGGARSTSELVGFCNGWIESGSASVV